MLKIKLNNVICYILLSLLIIYFYLPSRFNSLTGSFYYLGLNLKVGSFLFFLLFCFLIILIKKNRFIPKDLKWFTIYLFLFLFLYVLNYLIMIFFYDTSSNKTSIVSFLSIQFLPILLIFLVRLFNLEDKKILSLVKGYLLISFPILIFAVLFSLFPFEISGLFGWDSSGIYNKNFQRTYSFLGGAGITGIYATTTLFMSIYLLYSNVVIKKKIYILLIVISSIVILFSLTRSVIIATLFSLTIFFLILNQRKKIKYFIPILVILVSVFFIIQTNDIFFRVLSLDISNESNSDGTRFNSILFAFEALKGNPILGTGVGGIYPRDGEVDTLYLGNLFSARDPHNFYLLMLVENGFLGSIIVYSLYIFPIYYCWKRNSKILSLSLISILVYNIFSSSLAVGQVVAYIYWFIAAIAVQTAYNKKKENKKC